MRKYLFALSALALSAAASVSQAAEDPIAVRKALMQANGAAAGVAGAMMKGDIDYNPAVAKSVITSMRAIAHSFGDFFPEGTTGEGTTASPKIWEDAAGYQAALAKFMADTDAAAAASGKDGPADVAAFQAAIGPVFGNCKSCHEGFRVQNQ